MRQMLSVVLNKCLLNSLSSLKDNIVDIPKILTSSNSNGVYFRVLFVFWTMESYKNNSHLTLSYLSFDGEEGNNWIRLNY